MVKEFISQLPPDKLSPFEKHPYQVREDAAMDELIESIRVHGVLSPLLARPKGECCELVSGHRRRLAAQKLGLPTVPVLVREMTDDEAVILMVDSNLQRENLLPSEKAFAYQMKLEAMNRQGRRTDLTLTTVVPKFRSNEVIGKESGESRETVRRYIRLTNLVPPLLQMVDDGRIAFSPAVEMSYLTRDEQAELWDLIGREDATPSLSRALRMKQLSREAKLTPEVLYAILTEEKPNQKEQIRIKTESLRKYFPRNYSAQQMEREIIKLLEARYRAKDRGER
ncbi:MAG: ParB/RepB/Spo0J family partition protein [Oscillibacter sp.]